MSGDRGRPSDADVAGCAGEWGLRVARAVPADEGHTTRHWRLVDDGGRPWLARVEPVVSAAHRRLRVASYEAAREAAARCDLVVAPSATRDARVAVEVAPGALMTLTAYVVGAAVGGPRFDGDEQRGDVARAAAVVHRVPRPGRLPLWRPDSGLLAAERTDELEHRVSRAEWSGGPWSSATGDLLTPTLPVLRRAVRRFRLLAAAVSGHADRWVPTHGRLAPARVLQTDQGVRVVGWGAAALAPRERDLAQALGEANGVDPWFAYVEGGGPPEPLSQDAVELFTLERVLGRIVLAASSLARPHDDSSVTRARFEDLGDQLTHLVAIVARSA